MAYSGVGVVLLSVAKNGNWQQDRLRTSGFRTRRLLYGSCLSLDNETYLRQQLGAVGLPLWHRGYLCRSQAKPGEEFWQDETRKSAEGQVVAAMLVDMPGEWHNGLLSLSSADHRLLAACFPSHACAPTQPFSSSSDQQATPPAQQFSCSSGERATPTGWFRILDVVMLGDFVDSDSSVRSSDPHLQPVMNSSRSQRGNNERRDFSWDLNKSFVDRLMMLECARCSGKSKERVQRTTLASQIEDWGKNHRLAPGVFGVWRTMHQSQRSHAVVHGLCFVCLRRKP